MSLIIEDGKGRGNKLAINSDNHAEVIADTQRIGAAVSERDAETYVWTSAYSATNGDEVMYIKNTSSTKRLFIDVVRNGSVLNTLFEVFNATGTSTQAGTTSTGQNLNLGSGNTPESSSMGNAAVTQVTLGNRLGSIRVPALSQGAMDFGDELILNQNDSIAISLTSTTATIINSTVRGYFKL